MATSRLPLLLLMLVVSIFIYEMFKKPESEESLRQRQELGRLHSESKDKFKMQVNAQEICSKLYGAFSEAELLPTKQISCFTRRGWLILPKDWN